MSNFTFLTHNWPELYETAREVGQNVTSTPLSHRLYARRSLERAVKWLYANDSYLKQPYADNLAALILEPTFRENLGHCLFPKILTIQKIDSQRYGTIWRLLQQVDVLTVRRKTQAFCTT
jgi:type I restriction enzyme, R subunit